MGEVVELRRLQSTSHLPELEPLGQVGQPVPPARLSRRLRAGVYAIGLVLLMGATRDGVPVPLFDADFSGPNRLISNEFATHHPDARGARLSSQWVVTSGSLFVRDGVATNGSLDRSSPNANSSNGTDSAVFRAYTRQTFTPDYTVRFQLRVSAPQSVQGVRSAAWDGFHLIIEARSPAAAYYVSLFRRDGKVVLKKKSAGGPVAGGTYRSLSKYVPGPVRQGQWTDIRVDVRASRHQAVTIDVYEGGRLVTTATDTEAVSGSSAYLAGRLGLRADNTTFELRGFTVDRV